MPVGRWVSLVEGPLFGRPLLVGGGVLPMYSLPRWEDGSAATVVRGRLTGVLSESLVGPDTAETGRVVIKCSTSGH